MARARRRTTKRRQILIVLCLLGIAGPCWAVSPGARPEAKPPGGVYGGGDGRTGGDTIASATEISSIPFADSGTTTGFANDYDEACPYSGSTAPDVVYRYLPAESGTLGIDLCASSYDTKVYIYEDGQGNLVACNDDASCGYSGYQSTIDVVPVQGGHTYYIVIDGYGSSNGVYQLEVNYPLVDPVVECPPGSIEEGEPPCVDGYVDEYDGGCNGSGWVEVQGSPGAPPGCAFVCGKSCTYLYNGLSYRDTDWYASYCFNSPVTLTCTAEFAVQLILIYGPDCNALQYTYVTAPAGVAAEVSWNILPGSEFWSWVAPSVFSGVSESDYLLQICGIIGQPVPTQQTSWGQLKRTYAVTTR